MSHEGFARLVIIAAVIFIGIRSLLRRRGKDA